MKILMVHNRYQQRGGEDAVFAAEVQMLRSNGHDVVTLLENNDDITGVFGRVKTAVGSIYSRYGAQRVSGAVSSFRPDVMHVHNFFPKLSPSIFRSARKLGVPTVMTLHNYRLICPSASFYIDGEVNELSVTRSAFWTVPKRVYKNSLFGTAVVAAMVDYHKWRGTWSRDIDAFITLTGFARSRFVAAGFPESRLFVKPNFLKDVYQVGGHEPISRHGALYVGRLSREKGIPTLLEAWRDIDYPLTIIGGGEDFTRNAPANVSFVGELSRNDVHSYMAQSAFLIMPSEWYEGFPVTLLEGFISGLPVVTSAIGSLDELVEEGVMGFKSTPGSVDGLVTAIRRMLQAGEDGRALMGDAARRVALDRYTEEINHEQLLEIYHAARSHFAARPR